MKPHPSDPSSSVPDPALEVSALQVSRLLEQEGHFPVFIGGFALQFWGRPRFTKDLDLTLILELGDEREFVEFVYKHYENRQDVTIAEVIERRVLTSEILAEYLLTFPWVLQGQSRKHA